MAVLCRTGTIAIEAGALLLGPWPLQGEPWSVLFSMREKMRERQTRAEPMSVEQQTRTNPDASQRPKNTKSRQEEEEAK